MVRRTQELLGRVIRKPPLTERLLSKPPFRYLHDVIGEVRRGRGRGRGRRGLDAPACLLLGNETLRRAGAVGAAVRWRLVGARRGVRKGWARPTLLPPVSKGNWGVRIPALPPGSSPRPTTAL